MTFLIREAQPSDVADILRLVQALADYEQEPDAVEATENDFMQALFPTTGTPTTHALIAERDGAAIGLAIWYTTFSTWTGRNGIWLEDLFVDPAHRGVGAGRALLSRLAQICLERDWRRLEWWVLSWNEPSIAFSTGHWAQSRRASGRLTASMGRNSSSSGRERPNRRTVHCAAPTTLATSLRKLFHVCV